MGREIRLIRALADEGYQFTPQRRRAADPARPDGHVHVAARSTSRSAFMDEIEAGGVPVVMLRGDGQINPDGVRDYDLLVPATVEALVVERHADERGRATSATPRRWRERFIAEHGVIPPPSHP